MAEKRRRGRPPKNKKTENTEIKNIKKESIYEKLLNHKYFTFNSLTPNVNIEQIAEIFNNNDNNTSFGKIKQALSRFPEIEYLIDLYATSVVYNNTQTGIDINIIFEDEEEEIVEELNDDINNEDLEYYFDSTNIYNNEEGNEDNYKIIKKNKRKELYKKLKDKMFSDIKFEILELFRDNDVQDILYSSAKAIPTYGFCYIYLSEDYRNAQFFSPDDVKITYNKNHDLTKLKKDISTENDAKYDSMASNFKDLNSFEFYYNDEKLDKDRLFILSNYGIFGKSLILKIVHYLKILDLLEVSLMVERLSKAKQLNVQKINIQNLDEEDIQPILSVYRNAIQTKLSIDWSEDFNSVKSNIMKNIIDNNALLPVEGENFLKIDQIKNEFKPILEDINYYWEKIYYALGIPLYYRNVDLKNVSNIAMSMHEESFASKVRFYQNILNKFLNSWVELYLTSKYNVKIKYLDVKLTEYIPSSKRKETDADKAKKMLDVFTQLSTLLGIQLKQEFILSELFPDKDPNSIVEMPEEEEIPLDEGTDEEADNLFNLFMKTEATKFNKNKFNKQNAQNTRYRKIKFFYEF